MKLELKRIGDAYGVILPAEVLRALQVGEGGILHLIRNDRGEGFLLSGPDAEFEEQMRVARKLMSRYRTTLRELSQ